MAHGDIAAGGFGKDIFFFIAEVREHGFIRRCRNLTDSNCRLWLWIVISGPKSGAYQLRTKVKHRPILLGAGRRSSQCASQSRYSSVFNGGRTIISGSPSGSPVGSIWASEVSTYTNFSKSRGGRCDISRALRRPK